MARPANWNDIPSHERQGEEIARWSTHSVMATPSVAKHLVAAAEAAQKAGLTVTREGIFETLTSEQLEERLVRAQERWDTLKEKYQVAMDYPTKTNESWQINNWARDNGHPEIKFIDPTES